MKEQNGIQIFEDGDTIPMPANITEEPPSPNQYGYKVGQGKWELATEEDYRASEAQRLSIAPDAVTVTDTCRNTGPTSCSGFCPGASCNLVYNPQAQHYYCVCT